MRRGSDKINELNENQNDFVFDSGDLLTTREALIRSS
jgi:hypothetical protein